jgi:hypothetical protein
MGFDTWAIVAVSTNIFDIVGTTMRVSLGLCLGLVSIRLSLRLRYRVKYSTLEKVDG